jgi:hypothetical protein
MAFSIDGIAIKNPTGFKQEFYNITTLDRLSNGDMVGDLLSKKKKFYFTYEAITAEDLEVILSAIWDRGKSLFYTLTYPDNGVTKTARVYVGSIPMDLRWAGAISKDWVWKNVTFDLIEK